MLSVTCVNNSDPIYFLALLAGFLQNCAPDEIDKSRTVTDIGDKQTFIILTENFSHQEQFQLVVSGSIRSLLYCLRKADLKPRICLTQRIMNLPKL